MTGVTADSGNTAQAELFSRRLWRNNGFLFNDVFQEALKYCRNCKSISEPGYNKWIKILEPMKLENNVAYLLTDSDFSRDITMNAYENLF